MAVPSTLTGSGTVSTPPAGDLPVGDLPVEELPVRPELAGEVPYGAPQLRVPVVLNVNENPYPPSERVVAAIGAAAAQAARGLNRYPDRDALALRAELAAYLAGDTGVALAGEQVWAANGSNEVMLHVLQAFGGPGRTALSFAPTYSMYPEYARDTSTAWVAGRRAADFTLDPDAAVAMVREHRPDVVLLASPNNPTGTALPPATVEAVYDATPGVVVVDEAYAEFRRWSSAASSRSTPTASKTSATRSKSWPSTTPPSPGSRRPRRRSASASAAASSASYTWRSCASA